MFPLLAIEAYFLQLFYLDSIVALLKKPFIHKLQYTGHLPLTFNVS